MATAADSAHSEDSQDVRVLRLLSGPQAGAEVPLHGKEYLIGSAEDNDIVLQDGSVAAVHVALTLRKRRFRVEARDAAVVLAGGSLPPGESADLDFPAVVALGDTSLAVGPEGTDWDALEIPTEAEPEAEADPESGEDSGDAGESAAESGSETSASDPAGEAPEGIFGGAEPEAAGDAPAGEEAADATGVAAISRKLPVKMILSGLVVLLLVAAGVILWQSDRATLQEIQALPKPSDEEKVQGVLTKLGLDEVTVTTGQDGTLTLGGFVDKAATLATLLADVRNAGVEAVNRVLTVSDLMESTRIALNHYAGDGSAYHQNLKVTYAGKGVVQIYGYLGQDVKPQTLIEKIETDVPGITEIETKMSTLDDWIDDLNARLKKAGLQKDIVVHAASDQLYAEGTIDQTEVEPWKAVAKAFAKESGGSPHLTSG